MDALLKLGIDWQSIIFYVVNFGILFAVIGKFLVPPILNMLDKRREAIESSLSGAEKLKKEFQQKMAEIDAERAEAQQRMMKEMDNLNKTLEKKKSEMAAELQAQRQKMMEDAQREIETRKAQIVKDAEAQTVDLIKKVVMYIVQNKLPQELVEQSVKDAWKVYNK
jgi:F-type H+-transporting ATPase subunit b